MNIFSTMPSQYVQIEITIAIIYSIFGTIILFNLWTTHIRTILSMRRKYQSALHSSSRLPNCLHIPNIYSTWTSPSTFSNFSVSVFRALFGSGKIQETILAPDNQNPQDDTFSPYTFSEYQPSQSFKIPKIVAEHLPKPGPQSLIIKLATGYPFYPLSRYEVMLKEFNLQKNTKNSSIFSSASTVSRKLWRSPMISSLPWPRNPSSWILIVLLQFFCIFSDSTRHLNKSGKLSLRYLSIFIIIILILRNGVTTIIIYGALVLYFRNSDHFWELTLKVLNSFVNVHSNGDRSLDPSSRSSFWKLNEQALTYVIFASYIFLFFRCATFNVAYGVLLFQQSNWAANALYPNKMSLILALVFVNIQTVILFLFWMLFAFVLCWFVFLHITDIATFEKAIKDSCVDRFLCYEKSQQTSTLSLTMIGYEVVRKRCRWTAKAFSYVLSSWVFSTLLVVSIFMVSFFTTNSIDLLRGSIKSSEVIGVSNQIVPHLYTTMFLPASSARWFVLFAGVIPFIANIFFFIFLSLVIAYISYYSSSFVDNVIDFLLLNNLRDTEFIKNAHELDVDEEIDKNIEFRGIHAVPVIEKPLLSKESDLLFTESSSIPQSMSQSQVPANSNSKTKDPSSIASLGSYFYQNPVALEVYGYPVTFLFVSRMVLGLLTIIIGTISLTISSNP